MVQQAWPQAPLADTITVQEECTYSITGRAGRFLDNSKEQTMCYHHSSNCLLGKEKARHIKSDIGTLTQGLTT